MDASALLGSDPHDDDNEMSHLLLLEEGNASSAARARSASHAHASGRAPPGVSPGAPFDEDATWIEARGVRRDRFLNAVHHYFAEKGLNHALLARFLNTLTLAFSLGFSALILLYIDWGAIVGERAYDACARFATQSHETPAQACDAVKLGYLHHAPLRRLSSAMATLAIAYLAAAGAYVLWSARHFVRDVHALLRIRQFFVRWLGLPDAALEQGRVTWAHVLKRLVAVHRSHAHQGLSELDVVNCIMRKDNFLIALVNGGAMPTSSLGECVRGATSRLSAKVAAALRGGRGSRPTAAGSQTHRGLGAEDDYFDGMELMLAETAPPAPDSNASSSEDTSKRWQHGGTAVGPSVLLTKAITWNLYWCLLDPMFDDATMRVKSDFLRDVDGLRKRFRYAAMLNLCFAPFTAASLFLHYAMKHAEHFYSNPNAIVSNRGWSEVALWKFRLYNEVDHIFARRCARAHKPASEYVSQFPSPMMSIAMKFVSFVVGSFAALLIVLTFIDDSILEVHLLGRTMLWYAAVFGVVLTISRSLSSDEDAYMDPAKKLHEVTRHTYYAPASWASAGAAVSSGGGDGGVASEFGQFDVAHSRAVLAEFERFFKFKSLLFIEELAGVILAPYLLYFVLPELSDDILSFLRSHVKHTDRVGDVCSHASFDLSASVDDLVARGKVEKSVIAFYAQHPLPQNGDALDSREVLCESLLRRAREGLAPRRTREQGPADGPAAPVSTPREWEVVDLLESHHQQHMNNNE